MDSSVATSLIPVKPAHNRMNDICSSDPVLLIAKLMTVEPQAQQGKRKSVGKVIPDYVDDLGLKDTAALQT